MLRTKPCLLNIGCEPPLEEANLGQFGRLLIVLFRPFFTVRDLWPHDSHSWHKIYKEMGDSDWDTRTKPLRANIDSMQ
ncbi:unnamed protein product, partial [Laminaria digitata]